MTLRAPPERLVLLAGLSCLLLAGAARANPDVWASYAVVYRLEHRTAVGLTLEWRFDPFFSHRAMTAFDENGDGAFDGDEAGRLEAELVEPLARRGFYLHVLPAANPGRSRSRPSSRPWRGRASSTASRSISSRPCPMRGSPSWSASTMPRSITISRSRRRTSCWSRACWNPTAASASVRNGAALGPPPDDHPGLRRGVVDSRRFESFVSDRQAVMHGGSTHRDIRMSHRRQIGTVSGLECPGRSHRSRSAPRAALVALVLLALAAVLGCRARAGAGRRQSRRDRAHDRVRRAGRRAGRALEPFPDRLPEAGQCRGGAPHERHRARRRFGRVLSGLGHRLRLRRLPRLRSRTRQIRDRLLFPRSRGARGARRGDGGAGRHRACHRGHRHRVAGRHRSQAGFGVGLAQSRACAPRAS